MTYELSQDYLWKEIGDQVVVLHFESGRYYSLNPSGSVIWRGLLENSLPIRSLRGFAATSTWMKRPP